VSATRRGSPTRSLSCFSITDEFSSSTIAAAEAILCERSATKISQTEIVVVSSRCMNPTQGPFICTNSKASVAPARTQGKASRRWQRYVIAATGATWHRSDDQLWGWTTSTIHGTPNLSVHMPKRSPHICFSKGIVTVPPSESLSQ
jgi:hypothetical protein